MNERTQALLTQSGFRIFGTKVVAGDFGSSGNATACAPKLIELIIQDACQHLTNIGQDYAREQLEKYFGVE